MLYLSVNLGIRDQGVSREVLSRANLGSARQPTAERESAARHRCKI